MFPSRRLSALVACLALAAVSGPASAERLFGVTDAASPTLVSFDSANVAALTTIGAVSGLITGQILQGIDFRASNGLLYGLSSSGTAAQLYTINTSTGAASAIGSGFTLAGNLSPRVSIDFNPVVDVLRVVTGSGQNYRVNANTGALIAQDTTLSFAAGVTGLISGIAYTNNRVGATQTTLYSYNYPNDTLNTVGSVNGTPNSPNGGIVSAVGSSGVESFLPPIGFDISGATGIGYLSLDDSFSANNNSEFYTVNLATGAATLAGQFSVALRDISVATVVVSAVPEPGTVALMLGGLGVLGLMGRRRRPV